VVVKCTYPQLSAFYYMLIICIYMINYMGALVFVVVEPKNSG